MVQRVSVLISIFFSVLSGYAQFTNVTVGTTANDGTGDPLRLSFQKLNFADNWLKTNLNTLSNTVSGLVVGSATDKLSTNNGTAYGLTVVAPFTNASVTASKMAEFDSAKRLTNSTFGPSDIRTRTTLPTILATDAAYGAVGDYSGDMTLAGTGTDNQPLIQAALTAGRTIGSGGFGSMVSGYSTVVKLPAGKYYIAAPSDGSPSLIVPSKVVFDFSEAELHFGIPARNYTANGITEPNPAWCGILVGAQGGLVFGRMQIKWGTDQTYGGAWYGHTLDAVRVQEADISWLRGGSAPHHIYNWRGAGVRYIGCWNAFLSDVSIANCSYGVVMGYFGTAFSSYTRYRTGGTAAENVSTSLFIDRCSFVNIYRTAVFTGAGGDWNNPASASVFYGGLEQPNGSYASQGGPISITQSAFESVAFGAVFGSCPLGALIIENCRMEEVGDNTASLGVIYGNSVTMKINGITWGGTGTRSVTKATYTAANTSATIVPSVFIRCDGVNVSPLLQNAFLANSAINSTKLFSLGSNARLPTIINYRCNAATQMQGTDSSVQNIIFPNDGGRIWSVSTVGIAPGETVNGVTTAFTFPNGFTRQKPSALRQDGLYLQETNSDGTTNWSWDSGTTTVTTSTAPTKDLRAFF